MLKLFEQENLLRWHRIPAPVEIPRCRYEASTTNLIWHADIHFLDVTSIVEGKKPLLYAIIDDASRFIVDWCILPSKHADCTMVVARRAMEVYGRPYCFWTDNGGENRGDFRKMLIELEVFSVFTDPYSPEQNGKIERFWPLLEFNCSSIEDVAKYIQEYNRTPHSALADNPLLPGHTIPMCPAIAYQIIPKFIHGMTPMWKVEGKEQCFNLGWRK
jgi:transposase InsO family protein